MKTEDVTRGSQTRIDFGFGLERDWRSSQTGRRIDHASSELADANQISRRTCTSPPCVPVRRPTSKESSAGDVLLGIHGWQTSSMKDLAGILEHPDIQRGPRAKFYLVRREQTLFGHMELARNRPTVIVKTSTDAWQTSSKRTSRGKLDSLLTAARVCRPSRDVSVDR